MSKTFNDTGMGRIIAWISAHVFKKSESVTTQILSIDSTPTSNSSNLVTSGGVRDAIDTAIGSVYRVKGTKATYAELPSSGNVAGDVWNVTAAYGNYPAGTNWVWTGSAWDALGGEIDLSGKQDVLVSGTNIKTFVKQSLLGSGDIITTVQTTSEKPYLCLDWASLGNYKFLINARYSNGEGLAILDSANNKLIVISGNWSSFYVDNGSEVYLRVSEDISNVWYSMYAIAENYNEGTPVSSLNAYSYATYYGTDYSSNIIKYYSKPSTGIPASDLAQDALAGNTFRAVYGTTTIAEARAAIAAGKLAYAIYNGFTYIGYDDGAHIYFYNIDTDNKRINELDLSPSGWSNSSSNIASSFKTLAGQTLTGSGDLVSTVTTTSTSHGIAFYKSAEPLVSFSALITIGNGRYAILVHNTPVDSDGFGTTKVYDFSNVVNGLYQSGATNDLYIVISEETSVDVMFLTGHVGDGSNHMPELHLRPDDYPVGADLSSNIIRYYSKPSTGIPASDLASGVIPDDKIFVVEFTVEQGEEEDEVEVSTTTTFSEIEAAVQAGKFVIGTGPSYILTLTDYEPGFYFLFNVVTSWMSNDDLYLSNGQIYVGSENEVGLRWHEIFIPPAPGTLNTTATTAQSTYDSEALSGNITLHKVAKTGNYNDLLNKPTIPSAVTESTVSNWGFTKNTGTLTGVSFNGTAATVSNGVATITSLPVIVLTWNANDTLTFPSNVNPSSIPNNVPIIVTGDGFVNALQTVNSDGIDANYGIVTFTEYEPEDTEEEYGQFFFISGMIGWGSEFISFYAGFETSFGGNTFSKTDFFGGELFFKGNIATSFYGGTGITNELVPSAPLVWNTFQALPQILSGTSDPASSLGKNGDIYIKLSS